MFQTTHLQEKWQPVLDHPDLPKINDAYRRAVTTVILENQENGLCDVIVLLQWYHQFKLIFLKTFVI